MAPECLHIFKDRLNWRNSSDFAGPHALALHPSIFTFFSSLCLTLYFLLLHSNSVSLSFHQNLRKMEEESSEEPGRDLNELQNADWVGSYTPDL